jgi:hypothetical protein
MCTLLEGRTQHVHAVPPARVDDVLTGVYRPGRDQHLHDIVERVVRNGQEQQVGSFGHGRRLVDRGTRQQGLMRVRDASDSPATAAMQWPAS